MSRAKGRDSLTQEIVTRVEKMSGRDRRAAEWFYLYIETNDATGSVKAVGYDTKQPSYRANLLVKRFAPLIHEASILKRAAIESLAIAHHERILRTDYMVPVLKRRWLPEGGSEEEPLYDQEGKMVMRPDPRWATVMNRSADSVLDRSQGHRKGVDIELTSTGGEAAKDFRTWLEVMVDGAGGGVMGAQIVLSMPVIGEHWEFRKYLLERYPQPKQIEAVATEPQPERLS